MRTWLVVFDAFLELFLTFVNIWLIILLVLDLDLVNLLVDKLDVDQILGHVHIIGIHHQPVRNHVRLLHLLLVVCYLLLNSLLSSLVYHIILSLLIPIVIDDVLVNLRFFHFDFLK